MRQDLQKDMQRLKTEHAIDDSLIESLLASKSQANAHLNFWTRMMWGVNGILIIMFALISRFALRFVGKGRLWLWGVAALAMFGLLLVIGVLQRQRRARRAIVETALKHNLL